ncbi:SRPBCC domain-containing protein [Streptomyces sp. NBC_00239]|uniref:SRPBCC domain-containing protein n=1 Tax=Streptomyces sp. NBC_00239 TaxID=2903640 RepID=UPI002E2E4A81|nr:SRPBCC domain-containing protein [Streptomyces sp. NBC_00239]
MEHQVFVPVPAANLRAVLRDPARVSRCVPGLQRDADAESGPLAGRLKLRVGGSTVTYRGALHLAERDPDTFELTGEGTEARGTGTVKLSLTVSLRPVAGGTQLELVGTGRADGRAAAFDPDAVGTAARRVLDRAVSHLSALAAADLQEPGAATDPLPGAESPDADGPGTEGLGAVAAGTDSAGTDGPGPDADALLGPADLDTADLGPADPGPADLGPDGVDAADLDAADLDAAGADRPGGDDVSGTGPDAAEGASVFDAEVPPPSLDPFLDDEFTEAVRPPAEAAHARRTMIGRSAEEVDHAPPRGRYAPVPGPDAGASGGQLRWLAPAAALALASAVVAARALRRRR